MQEREKVKRFADFLLFFIKNVLECFLLLLFFTHETLFTVAPLRLCRFGTVY